MLTGSAQKALGFVCVTMHVPCASTITLRKGCPGCLTGLKRSHRGGPGSPSQLIQENPCWPAVCEREAEAQKSLQRREAAQQSARADAAHFAFHMETYAGKALGRRVLK